MRKITMELFDRVINALYPEPASESANFVGAGRSANGSINLVAWCQTLNLLAWFGFDIGSLYEKLVADVQSVDSKFSPGHLPIRPSFIEFTNMAGQVKTMEIGRAIDLAAAVREAIEAVAIATDDAGQPDGFRMGPGLLAMANALDELINKRIEAE